MKQRTNIRVEPVEKYDQTETCDRCGGPVDVRAPRGFAGSLGGDDTPNHFDVRVEIASGNVWPGDSEVAHLELDCCPSCAPVLIEALRLAGFTWHQYGDTYGSVWPFEAKVQPRRFGLPANWSPS